MRVARCVFAGVAFLAAGLWLVAEPVYGGPVAPRDGQAILTQGKMPGATAVRSAGVMTAMAPGDPVNISASLVAASNYLKHMQSDVTEDNAGNGSGVTESPNDLEDGGWDWVLTSPPDPFFHTAGASPPNLYGVTALGLYYGYLQTSDPSYFTAMTDAADVMVANVGIKYSTDMVFLMLYNDLPGVVGTAYKDAAKAKFDARIATYGSATLFAQNMRDTRGVTQGHPNGIIGWDLGAYVKAAAMLEVRYPLDLYDYATAASDMAEVLWQDSFNSNPGLFDIVADAGWDPTWMNANYLWYTLGVSGLIEAFTSSGTHMAEVPGLAARLLASQFSNGAISGSYGAHATDEDWQSTAYAAPALAAVNLPLYQGKINHIAYWLGATQDVSGGWKYGDNIHYPEIGGECASALALGLAPSYVIVDDGFTSQADVDVYNTAHSTDYVFGYDAVGTIAGGVNGVAAGGTVQVLAGTYNEVDITINKAMSVIGDPGTCGPGPDAPVLQGTGTGITERGFIITAGTDDVLIDGFVVQNYGGIPNQGGGSCGVWSYGTSADPVTNVTVQNCAFSHIRWAGIFFYNEGHSIFDNIQIHCNTVNMDNGMADNANEYGIECTNCKNSVISDNTVDGGWTGILMTAQALRSTPTSVTVEHNTISGNTVTGSVGWTGNVGIVSYRDPITNSALIRNITISGNQIANSVDSGYGAYGIRSYPLNGGTFADTMKVFNNSFTGNATKSLGNLTGILWDASGNYWGSSDSAAVVAAVSSNVDYTPWMQNPGTVLTPGFNGDFSLLTVDDNSPQFGAVGIVQEAVEMVSGSTILLMPGTYAGQVHMTGFTNLNLIGSGVGSTIIQPPAASMTKYFTTSGNNYPILFVENSDAVNISNLTVDGLGKGNINYRFMGVGYHDAGGAVSNCEVKDIRETPISGTQHGNGIYAYVDALPNRTLDVTNCWVHGFQKGGITLNGVGLTAHVNGCNVEGYGPASFIAMNGIQIGFGATGSIINNQVSGCNYTGAGWISAAMLLYNPAGTITTKHNTVTESQTGIYYINVGGNIDSNTVTNTTAGMGTTTYWWCIVADPGTGTSHLPSAQPFDANLALTPFGSGPATMGIATITTSATGNIVDGGGNGTGLEADAVSSYVGTETLNFAATGNQVTGCTAAMSTWEDPGTTVNVTLTSNHFLWNTYGIGNTSATISATGNVFANTTNGADDQPGNYYNANCWNDYNGTPPYPVGGAGGNVDTNPVSDCGLDMSPNAILYHCSGNFNFDVSIGDAVQDLEGAHVVIEYPAGLILSSVIKSSANYTLFYALTDNVVGNDVLTVDLGVLAGSQNGPAPLFTVTLSGSVDQCGGSQISMPSALLRNSANNPIIAPLASPVSLVADCADPVFAVNSPASGGFYNVSPVLDISATDNCNLDAVYYQIDGCLPGGWLPIAAGLVGTTYANPAWTMPGFAGLTEANHCIRFKVMDDNARGNADSCSSTWCFTKDVTPPPPPTDLVATPGHNKVHLSWTNAVSDFNHVVIMRSDWYSIGHGYPEYDDDNAEGPYPPDTSSVDRVYAGTASTLTDTDDLSNATRDVYHYRAFTVDAAGNVSVPSNNARSTSYWLGDIKSAYDGQVYFEDLTVFSSAFGTAHGNPGYNNEVDFGPTYNMSPKGIPTTDNVIDFEDLAIFAINFDAVNPLAKFAPIFADAGRTTDVTGPLSLSLVVPSQLPVIGETFTVQVVLANNVDQVKGIRFVLPYDQTRLELVAVTMNPQLRQSQWPVFFASKDMNHAIDASFALLGGKAAMGGSGEIASVTFKLLEAENVILNFDAVDMRDSENHRLDVVYHGAQLAAGSTLPKSFYLAQNYPNPYNAATQIVYQVSEAAHVSLQVYNVTGQLVKTLVDNVQEPGTYTVSWDARGENGAEASTGVYFYRMVAGHYVATKKMVIIK